MGLLKPDDWQGEAITWPIKRGQPNQGYLSLPVTSESEAGSVTLDLGDVREIDAVVDALKSNDSMQARVVTYGMRDAERGPDAVVELCRGAMGIERLRYERGLAVLATIGVIDTGSITLKAWGVLPSLSCSSQGFFGCNGCE